MSSLSKSSLKEIAIQKSINDVYERYHDYYDEKVHEQFFMLLSVVIVILIGAIGVSVGMGRSRRGERRKEL
jgi:hypothetical protein